MITEERLKHINENLRFGDKKKIAVATKVNQSTVENILYGKSYGEFGDIVTNEAEKLIKKRNAKLKKEKAIYGKP